MNAAAERAFGDTDAARLARASMAAKVAAPVRMCVWTSVCVQV